MMLRAAESMLNNITIVFFFRFQRNAKKMLKLLREGQREKRRKNPTRVSSLRWKFDEFV